jgi:hypothetical protein
LHYVDLLPDRSGRFAQSERPLGDLQIAASVISCSATLGLVHVLASLIHRSASRRWSSGSSVIAFRLGGRSVSARPLGYVMPRQAVMKFWRSFPNATANSSIASRATANHTSASRKNMNLTRSRRKNERARATPLHEGLRVRAYDRTFTQKTVVFSKPFLLKGIDRMLPAGGYRVVTDEELIEDRRVSTMIFVPTPSSIEMVTIDPLDLLAALDRDAAP